MLLSLLLLILLYEVAVVSLIKQCGLLEELSADVGKGGGLNCTFVRSEIVCSGR